MLRRRKVRVANSQLSLKGLSESALRKEVSSLKRQNDELLKISQSKDEFIAITSHQLRTPATGVKQYLGLLLEGYSDPLTDSQKSLLQKAYENNDRQLQIVDDLLKIAQLDLEKIVLKFKSQDINKLVEVALSVLKSTFEAKRQTIEFTKVETIAPIQADKEHLQLVIENLLENASNYSRDGQKIKVETLQKDKIISIRISDQGVGIDKKDMEKLFKKFSRIENPLSNTVSGSGLGLYFCQKIVKLHGGDINVESKLKVGTTFIVNLPVNKQR